MLNHVVLYYFANSVAKANPTYLNPMTRVCAFLFISLFHKNLK